MKKKQYCNLLGCIIFFFLCGCTTNLKEVSTDTADDTSINVYQGYEDGGKNTEKKDFNTYSQSQKMENSEYILKEIEGDSETPERELISFDDGLTWEYYEHQIKCYFPEKNVYRWERYCSKDGERQISIDDGKTWYYIRVNPENDNTEISQDKNEWIEIPSIETWTPIETDDGQYTSAKTEER